MPSHASSNLPIIRSDDCSVWRPSVVFSCLSVTSLPHPRRRNQLIGVELGLRDWLPILPGWPTDRCSVSLDDRTGPFGSPNLSSSPDGLESSLRIGPVAWAKELIRVHSGRRRAYGLDRAGKTG